MKTIHKQKALIFFINKNQLMKKVSKIIELDKNEKVPINSPPISQQGVSNLTSLFGELITKNSSSSSLYSNQQQQQPSTQPPQTQQQLESTTATTAPTTAPPPSTTTTNPATGEKDTIIANDIETDKLLNAIEKSKGFSDSYSTQATRRLRNRAIPFFAQPNSNSTNDRFQSRPDNSNRSSIIIYYLIDLTREL